MQCAEPACAERRRRRTQEYTSRSRAVPASTTRTRLRPVREQSSSSESAHDRSATSKEASSLCAAVESRHPLPVSRGTMHRARESSGGAPRDERRGMACRRRCADERHRRRPSAHTIERPSSLPCCASRCLRPLRSWVGSVDLTPIPPPRFHELVKPSRVSLGPLV